MRILLAFALTAAAVAAQAQPDRPAAAYTATADDVAAIQDGIAGALKVAPRLFPHGIGTVDVVMYDTKDLYVWTRGAYPFEKTGTWNGYNMYRLPHHAQVTERQMRRCAGSERFAVEALMPAVRSHFLFTCSPMGAQTAIQRRRGTIYDTRESYLATMVHEYGHRYMDQELWQIPAVSALAERVKKIATDTDKTSILEEAYAQYCELSAAKELYPAHYARLRADLHPDSRDPHELGLPAAIAVLDAEKR